MNKIQIAKRESYGRVKTVITTHALDVADVLGLPDEMTDLETAITNIDKASTKQSTVAIGTGVGEEAKILVGETLMKYILRARVKARRLGLTALANQLDEPITYYLTGAKVDIVSKAKAARDLLNDHKTELVVITAANITTIDGVIADYEAVKDEAVASQISTKAGGTDLLAAYFVAGGFAVASIIDLVDSYIGTTNPELTNELKLSAEVHVAGARHTSTEFTIISDDDGSNIANAEVLDNSNGKIYHQGTDHITVIAKHHPGDVSFTISAGPDYQPVSLDALLVRGTINMFNVRLKRVI